MKAASERVCRNLFTHTTNVAVSTKSKLAFRIEASVIVGSEARFAAMPGQKSTFITLISLYYHKCERGLSYNNTRDTSKDFVIAFIEKLEFVISYLPSQGFIASIIYYHREGALKSSRWSKSVFAMTLTIHRLQKTKW